MKSPTCTLYVPGSLRLAPIIHKPMNWLVLFTRYLRFFSYNSGTKYSNSTKFNFCTFATQSTTLLKLGKVTQKFSVPMGLTDH